MNDSPAATQRVVGGEEYEALISCATRIGCRRCYTRWLTRRDWTRLPECFDRRVKYKKSFHADLKSTWKQLGSYE